MFLSDMLTSQLEDFPDALAIAQLPIAVAKPVLFAWNAPLAQQLGLGELTDDAGRAAGIFGGNDVPDGAQPVALAYAGHQFGQFVPQLGDGRAVLLGQCTDASGRVVDVQLKGSGRTPFSRGGDGRAALGPVLREYLVSEAMHRMGVPTTRALAAVTTGETVLRETPLPGAVLTRTAASHVRVGTFEFLAARGDVAALEQLTGHVLARLYPEATQEPRPLALFRAVVDAQAQLIARWMSLGFIHGVMNTDNMAISGETIDYGPCAFMDEFDPGKKFSAIDRYRRYAYDQQPLMGAWNLSRLAGCLMLVHDEREAYEALLETFFDVHKTHYESLMASKLGLPGTDAQDIALIDQWLEYLHTNELDFSASFRALAARLNDDATVRFGEFETVWRERVAAAGRSTHDVAAQMNAANPWIIPRNHQIERAISAAQQQDFGLFERLQRALQAPYIENPEFADLAAPPALEQRVRRTFCGT